MITDTIAAIATALSESGIGIVRISGPESVAVADRILCNKKGSSCNLTEKSSHTIHHGYIHEDGVIIDEVLVLLMKGPGTYTGEDTVEIDCHGGVYVTRKILETVLKAGARIAEPGEFTKRAFLNGKMDLTQAEAVGDIIMSGNEYALLASVDQLKGSLLREIRQIRADILYQMAYIESALDDPEHISLDGYTQKLKTVMDEICAKTQRLVDSFDNGRMRKEGIRTVIIGKPNAGKSSLMNGLLGEERAIVTDIAGTTRDTLEERILLKGVSLNIIDTAGIHDTLDPVEKIGVDRAVESIRKSDLVLYVVDASEPYDEANRKIMELVRERKVIVLLNKSDLSPVTGRDDLDIGEDIPVIPFSATQGIGMEILEKTILDLFFEGKVSFNHEVGISNLRQKTDLTEALASLHMVMEGIEMDMSEDFLTIDLMAAYDSFGRVIGESVEEDLVNEIFARFCMGK